MAAQFRFTLRHATVGTKIISEPDGWQDSVLKLERHPDYHSLVEYFTGEFIFYGSDGVVDGGIDFIKNIENRFGINTKLEILIDLSVDDGEDYENVFTGLLDLESIEELKDNKLKCAIIRDDLWAKFIARRTTPVNLKSTTNLDGTSATAVSDITLQLPSQTVRSKYKRTVGYNAANAGLFTFDQTTVSGTTAYLIFDTARNELDEIENRYEYGAQISEENPTEVKKFLIQTKYPGDYNIDADIRFTLIFGASRNASVKWYLAYKVNDTLTTTQIGTTTSVSASISCPDDGVKSINTTLTLPAAAEVYIYGELTLNSGTTVTYFPDYDSDTGAGFSDVYTSLEITADTTYQDSEADAFLVHDAGAAILSRITGKSNPFYSSYFGSSLTNARVYGSNGCGWTNVITQGLQIRGYDFTDKQFSLSFEKWWNGVNPMFNLGLGYDIVSGSPVIKVEEKHTFYDDSSVSVYFDNIRDITRKYDKEIIFKKIEIGHQRWQAENSSGLDDPQTKKTYATVFDTAGRDITLYSEFIAAALALEETRRKTIEQSADYRMDNEVFIVSINPTAVSSDVYEPELSENFLSVSGVINYTTRYNLRHTPGRAFLRWQNFFNGCLQKNSTSYYKFVQAEGNYSMASAIDPTLCRDNYSGASFSESQDVSVTNDYLMLPEVYSVITDLSFDDYVRIRSNRTKAIAISQTDEDHKKFFIKSLEYEVCNGKATMEVWPAEPFSITVVN